MLRIFSKIIKYTYITHCWLKNMLKVQLTNVIRDYLHEPFFSLR